MDNFFQARISTTGISVSGDLQITLGGNDSRHQEIFASWDWDGKRFELKNDRCGMYPVYYCCTDQSISVSPSITKLLSLGADPELDEDAFAVFLRLGWLIGEDTIFKSIRAVPPASVLSWQDGKLNIISENLNFKAANISRQEAIETYAGLFQKAIENNLPSGRKIALPLSGGRDSRHILFALHQAGIEPDACLTVIHPPPRPNEDARIARQVCEALQQKHFLVEQSLTRFAAEQRKNELTGFCTDEHGWFVTCADYVKENWNVFYDGIGGDVLSAGLYLDQKKLDLFRRGKFADLADEILLPEGFLPSLLTKENYRKFNRGRAIAHLAKELPRHAGQPNPVGSLYFCNRTRRCVALLFFRLLERSVTINTPYLEKNLFDFLSSLPAEMLIDHQFHTDTINFSFPAFARIPYENKRAAPTENTAEFRKFSLDILSYGLTKRSKKLINRKFLLTRCLRCVLDKNYSRTVTEFGSQTVLLQQIERL